MDKLIIGIGIAAAVCIITAIIEGIVLRKNDSDSFENYINKMKKGG